MMKTEFWDEEINRLAGEKDDAQIADVSARLRILLMKLLALLREYSGHPHGGDPRAIDAGHENERNARLTSQTERAFIVIAGLAGGVFLWLAITTSYPWWVLLPIIIALWLPLSWAITYALRNGLAIVLRVVPSNPNAAKVCRIIFTVSLAGFVIFLAAFTLSRFMAIGSPDLVGLEQTLVELCALICAAAAGALHQYYVPICELVEKIRSTMRDIAALRAQAQALNQDISNIDRLVAQIAANGTSSAKKPIKAGEIEKANA